MFVLSLTDLSYNCALCYYMMRQYAPSLKHIAEIIERGIKEHPGVCDVIVGHYMYCTSLLVVSSCRAQCGYDYGRC